MVIQISEIFISVPKVSSFLFAGSSVMIFFKAPRECVFLCYPFSLSLDLSLLHLG